MKTICLIVTLVGVSACGSPTAPEPAQARCFTYVDTITEMRDGLQVTYGGTQVEVSCHGWPGVGPKQ